MRELLVSLIAVLVASCSAPPHDVPRRLVASPMPEGELSRVEQLGLEIYLKDIAAHRATDAVVDRAGTLPGEIAGWITLSSGTRSRVLFVNAEAKAVYSAELDVSTTHAPVVTKLSPPVPLDPGASSMWAARQAALSADFRMCSDRYNTVVLEQPGATPPAWFVYLLAATTEPDVVMLGGHHRFSVSEDGTEILEHLPLTNSCVRSGGTGIEAAALAVTHVITDEPIESHVYLSLLHGLPLYVGTDGAVWAVENGRVRRVE